MSQRSVSCGRLLFGLVGGLAIGLPFGFSGKQLIERFVLSPNEGIRRSLKNGLVVGLVSGLLHRLVVGLVSGLGAATQHYTLRFCLWRTRTFPWKVQRFLDDAVVCILLRRIGGGYSFVHRLLLDYFADLPTEPPSTSATHSPAPSNSPSANTPSV